MVSGFKNGAPHARTRTHITVTAAGTVEEVSRLAGEAARVTPAVHARRRTGQTHTPDRVLVGALRTMSAALVSETGKTKATKTTFNPQVKAYSSSILISLSGPGPILRACWHRSKTDDKGLSHARRLTQGLLYSSQSKYAQQSLKTAGIVLKKNTFLFESRFQGRLVSDNLVGTKRKCVKMWHHAVEEKFLDSSHICANYIKKLLRNFSVWLSFTAVTHKPKCAPLQWPVKSWRQQCGSRTWKMNPLESPCCTSLLVLQQTSPLWHHRGSQYLTQVSQHPSSQVFAQPSEAASCGRFDKASVFAGS